MKKPIYTDLFKALVRDSAFRHAINIGVAHYDIQIIYIDEDLPESDDGHLTLAEMDTDRRYLTAKMKIYPHLLEQQKKNGDGYLDQTIGHEISHIATQHLYDVATAIYRDRGEMEDAWESLTEVIGRLSTQVSKLKLNAV